MVDDHIDVSIEMNHQQLDLRIPVGVTMDRLSTLVGKVLDEHGIELPPSWHLKVRNKPINIGHSDFIKDFPVGTGDILTVVSDS